MHDSQNPIPTSEAHVSVLLHPSVEALLAAPSDDCPEGIFIDATFGRGGHAREILQRLSPNSTLLAFDKDPDAVALGQVLAKQDSRFQMVHDSFANMAQYVQPGSVAGVLMDLGVSSPQLDQADRGFSFTQDGPLDMRMDNTQGLSAADWIAGASEQDIANILYRYGEERFSRRLAKAIVSARQQRPITRTSELAEIIKQAHPKWEPHRHPATRSFQGIRIFINQELNDLEQALTSSLEVLKDQGRLVVISFHSLEDRIVKQFIRLQEQGPVLPKELPVQNLHPAQLQKVGKAIKPDAQEVNKNVRARSAVMRVAIRHRS